MPTREQMQAAETGITLGEEGYLQDWIADSQKWEEKGLYRIVGELVDPKDGRFVADMGTGLGLQLVWLAGANPRGLYIGTERTPRNVELAKRYLNSLGLDAVSALLTQGLAADREGRLYWKQRHLPQIIAMRAQILALLDQHLLLMDDDIRRPQALPAVLGGEKLDAAIFSMPGGAATRAYEWPFHADDPRPQNDRILEASNATRTGFYHYASGAVREEGKIVIAERLAAPANANVAKEGVELIGKQMGGYRKYWTIGRVGGTSRDIPGKVDLRATHAQQQFSPEQLRSHGHAIHAVVVELLRNTVTFDEPALPQPEPTV